MHRIEYLIWLKHMGLSSNSKFLEAIEYFSSPEELYNAGKEEYTECGMFSEKEIEYLLNKDMTFVKEEIERCNKERTYLVDYYSKAYPSKLRSIPEPPLVLYVKGDKTILNEDSVTMVGSRKADGYGIAMSQDIAGAFVSAGYVIVSGMAEGIDQSSMLGAMNAGGKTIGVLCSGIDVDYPQGSEAFKEKVIAKGGAIISEFEFGKVALPGYFPIRNRIMAGLSDLTVVVEATEKSGALITAKKAMEYGNEAVFVPGRIDSPESMGCNMMIAGGHKSLYDVQKFIYEMKKEEIKAVEAPKPKVVKKAAVSEGMTESDNMVALLDLLKENEMTAEELAVKSGRAAKWVASTLIILEVSGKVKMLPGGKYKAI